MTRTLSVVDEILPLHTPFRISRGVKSAAEVVTVAITQGGIVGRGECVPYPRYGENAEGTMLAIEAMREAIEGGVDRRDLMEMMPAGAARNALDCALWDLDLRAAGRRAAIELGRIAPLRPVATAMTVSLDTPARMAAAAAALRSAPLLKVKVDRNNPAAQIEAVRGAAPNPKMIVDPNESWTIAELNDLQNLLTAMRVDLLEQPLPAGADHDLDGFRSSVRIAADESVHVAADLDGLPSGYDVVNIKLDKSGGLTAALDLMRTARERGLEVMTGCMICSSLSIAPAWSLAMQSAFADLDGPLWLAEDRVGGVRAANGMLSPPQPDLWGGI